MKTVEIWCKNNNERKEIPLGSNLSEIFQIFGLEMKYGPVSAKVNNKVEGLHFRVYNPKTVEFLDMESASGSRTYTRTLFFVLCKAVHNLYKDCTVSINTPVSNGYYVDLKIGRPITLEEVGQIRNRMQEIIDAAYPIHRHETTTEEAIRLFESVGAH
jgi:uridine kinase